MKAYCVDVSASMTYEQVWQAYTYVSKGIETNDIIILFDIHARQVTLEQFRQWFNHNPYGNGGSDVTECLVLVSKLNVYSTILISDGFLLGTSKFSKFIKV